MDYDDHQEFVHLVDFPNEDHGSASLTQSLSQAKPIWIES